MKKNIIILSICALISLSFFLSSCGEPVQYVNEFKWGSISTMFSVKGNPQTVIDTIVDYEKLLPQNVNIPILESKRKHFAFNANAMGFPTYICYLISDTTFLEIYINSATRVFDKIVVSRGEEQYASFFQITGTNAYKVFYNSNTNTIESLFSETFDTETWLLAERELWNIQTKIPTKHTYTTTSQNGEARTVNLMTTINNVPSSSTVLDYNTNGWLTKEVETETGTGRVTTTEYTYGNIDAQGNWTTKFQINNGDTIVGISRTITY